MFGEIDLINDLTEKSLANWCTIQLLCNVRVTFGWLQFGEIMFIRQTFPLLNIPAIRYCMLLTK